MIRFFIITAAIGVTLVSFVHFAYNQAWISQLPSFLYESTVIVIFTTGLIFVYLFRSRKPSYFVQLYLLSMVVKLLACLAYTILMILDDRSGAVINVTYFLVAYGLFTAVEICFLYRRISGKSRP